LVTLAEFSYYPRQNNALEKMNEIASLFVINGWTKEYDETLHLQLSHPFVTAQSGGVLS